MQMPSPSLKTRAIPCLSKSKHCGSAAGEPTETGIGSSSSSSSSASGQRWAEDSADAETGEVYHPLQHTKKRPASSLHQLAPAPALSPPALQLRTSPAQYEEDLRLSRTLTRPVADSRPAAFSRSPGRREPTRLGLEGDFMPTLTGDKEGLVRITDKGRGGLSSWFAGSSAPMPMGLSTMDSSLPTSPALSSPSSPTWYSPKPATQTLGRTSTVGGGLFNFFAAKSPPKPQHTVQIPAELNDDEFLTLDVRSALFPGGEPSAQDPFSPAAFNNLLINAEGLLEKLQTAYKLRTLSLHELSAEKSAMSEEIEEAETRARSLKSQLEDMARQVALRDSAMDELGAELAAEKQARAEEKAAREQSIALIGARRTKHLSIDTTNEDLGISCRPRNRRSEEGASSIDDGDSDAESADSVFSRSRSPAFTMCSVSIADPVFPPPPPPPKAPQQAPLARTMPSPARDVGRPPTPRRQSTFQKVLSGLVQSPTEKAKASDDAWAGIGMGEEGCGNCRGRDASVAWDAVGLMRAENRELKGRVEGLEKAVKCALDLCNGIF